MFQKDYGQEEEATLTPLFHPLFGPQDQNFDEAALLQERKKMAGIAELVLLLASLFPTGATVAGDILCLGRKCYI